jgi:hypothetical protein
MIAKTYIEKYTKQLLANSLDGERYFDLVDEFVRTTDIILYSLYHMKKNKMVVMSGKIAATYMEKGYKVDLVAPSGIRKGATVDFSHMAKKIKGRTFTFIDDSYYKGRTFLAIKKEIQKYGGNIDEVIVAYNGGDNMGIKSLISYRELSQ